MNHHIRRGYTMLEGAIQFAVENPIDSDLAASLLAELQLRVETIRQTMRLQRHGKAAMLGAAENRQDHANALREIMRDLARIARVLDPREHPDLAVHMRTANLKVYSELLSRAQCFIDAARPIKEVFIAYGAPADFLARMESLITAVNAAENRKFSGKGEWINATATLTAQTREAIRTLRKLEVIHANYYRPHPGLAAAWQTATHIERARKKTFSQTGSTSSLDSGLQRSLVIVGATLHADTITVTNDDIATPATARGTLNPPPPSASRYPAAGAFAFDNTVGA